MKKETKSKVTHIDNMLRNGLEKNIGISKEQNNNYLYFLKKHIENNLGKSITNNQAITIEKLITKSVFLGEVYIFGLIENNKHLINICEALKLNSFYEACVFNNIFSTRQHEISEINFFKNLNRIEKEHNQGLITIPFDAYSSEKIVCSDNFKDALLYSEEFEKEALWMVNKFEIVKFIESQQNFCLEHYEYPINSFGRIKFFSIMSDNTQKNEEIFLIAKKTDFNKGLREIIRMKRINTILLKSESQNKDFKIKIVPLFALFKKEHDCYLITKYIPGKTFDDILRMKINKKTITRQLKEIKNLLFTIGIGWKDLAPRNIISCSTDDYNTPTYYLCDFERDSIIKEGGITERDKAYIEEHAFEEFVDHLSQKELDYLFPSINKNSLNSEQDIDLTEIESNRIKTLLKNKNLLFTMGNNVCTKKKYIDYIRRDLWLCAKPLKVQNKIISTLCITDLLTDKIDITYRIHLIELLLRSKSSKNYKHLISLLDTFAKIYITLLLQDEYESRIKEKTLDINVEISGTFARDMIDLLKSIVERGQMDKLNQQEDFHINAKMKFFYDRASKIAKLLEFFGFQDVNYHLGHLKNGKR